MLRLIHSSDWHLTAGKFFDETLRCLQFIRDTAAREKVDAVLLPGDFTHSDLPHRVQTPLERLTLANVFPYRSVLTYGNHDIPGDLELFSWLPNVDGVFREARLDHCAAFDILALPYPHKRHWLSQRVAGAVEGQRQELGHALGQTLRALAQQRRPGVPLIGLAHLNIAGSKVGGGEVLIGQEIELSPADLDEIGCDYWALGHIHNPQQMAERAWYAGTPQPHSFGDSNVNGFNLVELEAGQAPRVTFIETPATKLLTVEAAWMDGRWQLREPIEVPAGARVRVVATVDEADRDVAFRGAEDLLQQGFIDAGASGCRIDRRIIPTTRVRSEQIRSAHTPAEKLHAFWATLEPAPAEQDRAAALEALDELADG